MPDTPATEWEGWCPHTPRAGAFSSSRGSPPLFLNCIAHLDSIVDQDRPGQRTSSPEPMVAEQPWAFVLMVRRSIRGITEPESTRQPRRALSMWPTDRALDSEWSGNQMQTLQAYRVYTLQVDEGCTTAHTLIGTMLNPTAHCAVENGPRIEVLNPWRDTHPGLHVFS